MCSLEKDCKLINFPLHTLIYYYINLIMKNKLVLNTAFSNLHAHYRSNLVLSICKRLRKSKKTTFSIFSSKEIGSSWISFGMILEALKSEQLRFKFQSLSSEILKIPEFNLSIGHMIWTVLGMGALISLLQSILT